MNCKLLSVYRTIFNKLDEPLCPHAIIARMNIKPIILKSKDLNKIYNIELKLKQLNNFIIEEIDMFIYNNDYYSNISCCNFCKQINRLKDTFSNEDPFYYTNETYDKFHEFEKPIPNFNGNEIESTYDIYRIFDGYLTDLILLFKKLLVRDIKGISEHFKRKDLNCCNENLMILENNLFQIINQIEIYDFACKINFPIETAMNCLKIF